MDSAKNRRKGMRAAVPAELFFNILGSPDEYSRERSSILKRLEAIDSIKVNKPQTESQILLSRIDLKLSILIGILVEGSSRKSYAHHAELMDISEFGLSFLQTLAIEKDSILEIALQLPEDDKIRIMEIGGKVVHVKKSPDSNDSHIYGVEFFDIKSSDQDSIVQWIFAHQREEILRRREKRVEMTAP